MTILYLRLFAFNAFTGSANFFLNLAGPSITLIGMWVTLTVTDGPVAGATVNGDTSNVSGEISITFMHPGTQKLKATKSDALY